MDNKDTKIWKQQHCSKKVHTIEDWIFPCMTSTKQSCSDFFNIILRHRRQKRILQRNWQVSMETENICKHDNYSDGKNNQYQMKHSISSSQIVEDPQSVHWYIVYVNGLNIIQIFWYRQIQTQMTMEWKLKMQSKKQTTDQNKETGDSQSSLSSKQRQLKAKQSKAKNTSWHICYLLCQEPRRNYFYILLMKTSDGSRKKRQGIQMLFGHI